MTMKPVEINCLVYQEGNIWIAQGLEFDITAQAKTLPELHSKFTMKILAEYVIALDLEREPFFGVNPAPKQFWEEFNAAEMAILKDVPPFEIEDDGPFAPQFTFPNMRIAQNPIAAVL